MTASKDYSPIVASAASDASMFHMIGPDHSGPVVPSPVRVWGRVLRAFDSMPAEPLKTQIRRDSAVA
jgi:hypothetical protein